MTSQQGNPPPSHLTPDEQSENRQSVPPTTGAASAVRGVENSNPVSKLSRATYKRIRKIQNRLIIVIMLLTIAANLLSIPGHIQKARLYLFEYFGVEYTQFWRMCFDLTIFFMLLAGYSALAFWLYMKYISTFKHRARIFYGAVACVGALLLFGANIVIAIPKPLPLPLIVERVQKGMTKVLLSQQTDGTAGEERGGFRFAQHGGSQDTQVMTTAQVLYALEIQDPALPQISTVARIALTYIEKSRVHPTDNNPCQMGIAQQDGWAYMKPLSWGVTEINSWVLLAELASLRPSLAPQIWAPAETPAVVTKIKQDLIALANRQHNHSGWAPIAKTDYDTHLRTYSTVMALWALEEARRNVLISKEIGHMFDQPIEDGFRWLLSKWVTDDDNKNPSGLQPNPSWKEPVSPGLTAQAIYVLELIRQDQPGLDYEKKFAKAKSKFVEWGAGESWGAYSLQSLDVSTNLSLNDSDRYLEHEPYTVEGMTFLWYPWTVAALKELKDDDTLPPSDRRTAAQLWVSILRRIDGYWTFAEDYQVIYPIAEGLVAININLPYLDKEASACAYLSCIAIPATQATAQPYIPLF